MRDPDREEQPAERRRDSGEFLSFILVVYFVGLQLMLLDLLLRDALAGPGMGLAMPWVWGPIVGLGTPVMVYQIARRGLDARAFYIGVGICGSIVFLMDVGGLTVRRFMLWYIWAPALAVFLIYWVVSKPSRDRERAECLERKPMFARRRPEDDSAAPKR